MSNRSSDGRGRMAATLLSGVAALLVRSIFRTGPRRRGRLRPVPVATAATAEPTRRGLRTLTPVLLALVAGFGLFLAGYAAKREQERDAWAAALTGGDPAKGPDLMLRYGCAGCHEVRGVRGPGGLVGPPLTTVGKRVYIAGRLINTPANLVHWITNPREVDPKTAMPVTGISDAEARDVAAYLLALR